MAPKRRALPKERKSHPDRTAESILDAAVKLFLAKGYEATSTRDICAVAGLTKPTLYYHFNSKNDLLFAVHMRGIEKNLKPYMEKVKRIDGPMLRFLTMLEDYTRMICADPNLRFLMHGTLTIEDNYSKEIKEVWKEHYHLLRDTIRELQLKGAFDGSINPSSTALLLLGMITWVTYWFDYRKKRSKKIISQSQPPQGHKRDRVDEIVALVQKIALQGLTKNP